MFGKKAKGAGTAEPQAAARKAKPQSVRDTFTEKIDQLTPGQEVAFRLPPIYGSELIVVEANKDYPAKGHRYSLASADPVDGKPGQNRKHLWETDKPRTLAAWIVDRSGELIP